MNYLLQNSEKFTSKSYLKASFALLTSILFYLLTLIGSMWDFFPLPINLLFSFTCGLAIARLFVIAHDAAHDALVESKLVNMIIARGIMPLSLHSYSLWKVTHNQNHHGFSNIKNRDRVWTPCTLKEFDHFSAGRKLLERVYRSEIGAFIYYGVEMWFKLLFISFDHTLRKDWKKHFFDNLYMFFAVSIQIAGIIFFKENIAKESSII